MVKMASSKARGEREPGRIVPHPPAPELPRQLVSRVEYVEDSLEPRTKIGKRHVSRLVKTVIQLGHRRVKTADVPSEVR